MKTLTIKITKKENGYVCIASNGDMPFEGRIHPTKKDALNCLNAAYNNVTWRGRVTSRGYSIDVD